jgi:hypothetical protein
LFEPLLWAFAKANTLYTLPKLLDMMFYGFRDKTCDTKKANAGIVHNPFNMLGVADQFKGLDLSCRVALIPCEIGGERVTKESILSWNGEELTVLVLPQSIEVGTGYFGFSQMDGMYVNEIESNDPKVINSIDIFNELSLMISGRLAHDEIVVSTNENKVKLSNFFRQFLQTQETMPCLKVPGKHGLLKVQKFPSRSVTLPGRNKKATRNLDFSAPHPFLLVLRGMNAWCDYLHLHKAWPKWTEHIQKIAKKERGGNELIRARLVILPGCCDVSRYEPDCILCKCNCLITSSEMYWDLADSLLEKAKMFIFAQIPLSMDSCDAILEIKSAVSRMTPTEMKRKKSRPSSSRSTARTEMASES